MIASPDEVTWAGVRSLVDHYVALRPSDQVVLVYTQDAREPASWVLLELRSRGVKVHALVMSMYDDPTLAARLTAVLPPVDRPEGRLVVLTLERTSMANSAVFRSVLAPYAGPDLVVGRTINASPELFRLAMNVTPDQLSAINGGLLQAFMPAERMQIRSTSGTDLDIRLESHRYRWISNRGMWRPGGFTVLPPGEVATMPADVNGVLVSDGAFNITAFTEMDVRLAETPVTVEFEKGRVVNFACASPLVQKLYRRFTEYDHFDRVGELGFGTNIGITEWIPMNSHINERRPGLHIGLGGHGQRLEVAGYGCEVHLDLMTSDAVTTVDGGTTFDSRRLGEVSGEHPALQVGLHDEDIDALDGDCCGLTWGSPLTSDTSCPVVPA
jgi:hypothetical protein